MENLGALEIPVTTLVPIERGSNKQLNFTTYTNKEDKVLYAELTDASILFELKKSKTSSTILKKATANLPSGGSDQISITDDHTFILYLIPDDTSSLQDQVYWGLFTITTVTSKIQKKWVEIPFI